MKRHAGLRRFSDDHHQGLVNARRLKRAAAGEETELADAAGDFLEFWRRDTRLHFREEEEVLLPVLARHGGTLAIHPWWRCSPSTPGSGGSQWSWATSSGGRGSKERR